MYILKFVLRSWWRNKLFVTISLVSLVIGIACTNLLTAFVLYEYNIEYNNHNRDRILRLTQTLPFAQQEMQGTFVYHESVPEIISQFPEIEASLRTQAITHTKIRCGRPRIFRTEPAIGRQYIAQVYPHRNPLQEK